jgi:Protein of unknown function (DUF3140)
MAKSDEQVIQEFDEAVNMTRKELEEWLQTQESKSVGQDDPANPRATSQAERLSSRRLETPCWGSYTVEFCSPSRPALDRYKGSRKAPG